VNKDHVELIDQLVASLSGNDPILVDTAINNIESTGMWRPAIMALTQISPPTPAISERFHNKWTERGHRIREKVGDDRMLLNALRILLPRYDGPVVSLYRGENTDRWTQGSLGFAWTLREDIARMFARGLNAGYGKGGILLSTDAPTEAIIAGPSRHSVYLDEHEYVVDPRCLRDIVPIEQFPRS
jgi:hypothetical protein